MTTGDPTSADDAPFEFRETSDGRVQISYRGKVVTQLTGRAAERFVAKAGRAEGRDLQLLMARASGNFKRGNERLAKRIGRGR